MLDPKRIMAAESKGVAFVCRMCTRWYEGEDRGLTDDDGDARCNSSGKCYSPIKGGSFDEHDGPLAGHLDKYCFMCGKRNPEHALEAQTLNAKRVGCCSECLLIVQKTAIRDAGRNIKFQKISNGDSFKVRS
jgi:hypothetical protein